MIGGNTFADDAARYRDELVVDVGDAELVDFFPHLLDEIVAPGRTDMGFQIGHFLLLLTPTVCTGAVVTFAGVFPRPFFLQLQGNGLWETGCSFPSA